MADSAVETRQFQVGFNVMIRERRVPLRPISVDGEKGPETRSAIHQAKLCVGWLPKYARETDITPSLLKRMAHPFAPSVFASPRQITRGLEYRKKLRRLDNAGVSASRHMALAWLHAHRGLTEQPPNSNQDNRRDGITAAEIRCAGGGRWLIGEAWCGTWAWNALNAAGVQGIGSWMAGVKNIEDYAKASKGCYKGWTLNIHAVTPGDQVVLFGRGIHVETVIEVHADKGYIITDGGNTSSGPGGSQSNGGGSFKRTRYTYQVHGFALVRYPGE